MVDRWLGHAGHVEHFGLIDNTMIILVTDHGHLFGEHGMIGKPWADLEIQTCIRNLLTSVSDIPPSGNAGRQFLIWLNRWTCSPLF
jgi:hypothetical protein